MHDHTSILNAAREMTSGMKSESYACCIGNEVISLPKKKSFNERNDIVPELYTVGPAGGAATALLAVAAGAGVAVAVALGAAVCVCCC